MKLVFKEQVNLIGEVKTSTYTVTTNPITEYGNIPMSIGTQKGDLISFTAAGTPKVIHAGNADGKVLMTDSTTDTGWTLGAGGSSSSAAITLTNASGVYIESGTVVYVDDALGGFKKALSNTVGQLYVTADNTNPGESCGCYSVKGAVCNVQCTSAAVNVGDQISVYENGICAAVTGVGTVGVALAAKEEGSVGTVTVRLTDDANANTVLLTNASPDTLLKGELVVLSTTTANAVERCPVSGIPIGVVASGSIEAGAVGQIATVNGSVVEAKCTAGAVAVGDMLTASTNVGGRTGTAGQAAVDGNSHNAYGVGYALEAKEAGAVGNVKTLLGVMVKLRNANKWYLADGLTEKNVIAAWKFKNTHSLEAALANVNSSRIDYTLTVYGNVTKFNMQSGLSFPAETDCYVDCAGNIHSFAVSCAFGFQEMATGSVVTAGTTRGKYGNSCASYLLAKGGANYKHCMNTDTNNQYMQQNGTIHANGVLACNWLTTGGAMYYNGVKQSTSQATGSKATKNGWTQGRVFTTASSGTMGSMNLNCLVFYNVNLTDAQHVQVYEQMNALGLAG